MSIQSKIDYNLSEAGGSIYKTTAFNETGDVVLPEYVGLYLNNCTPGTFETLGNSIVDVQGGTFSGDVTLNAECHFMARGVTFEADIDLDQSEIVLVDCVLNNLTATNSKVRLVRCMLQSIGASQQSNIQIDKGSIISGIIVSDSNIIINDIVSIGSGINLEGSFLRMVGGILRGVTPLRVRESSNVKLSDVRIEGSTHSCVVENSFLSFSRGSVSAHAGFEIDHNAHLDLQEGTIITITDSFNFPALSLANSSCATITDIGNIITSSTKTIVVGEDCYCTIDSEGTEIESTETNGVGIEVKGKISIRNVAKIKGAIGINVLPSTIGNPSCVLDGVDLIEGSTHSLQVEEGHVLAKDVGTLTGLVNLEADGIAVFKDVGNADNFSMLAGSQLTLMGIGNTDSEITGTAKKVVLEGGTFAVLTLTDSEVILKDVSITGGNNAYRCSS